MPKHLHLTKERELELGVIIQQRLVALSELQSPDISEEDTLLLEAQVAEGNTAIEELVKANMGLVYDRARNFKNKFPGAPDLEDLVSMGCMGLMTAVHKYDPKRGNKFSTLAYYWISQAIGRETNKTSRLVRLPENRISDYTRMNQVKSKYEESAIGASELDRKITSELGLTRTEILNIRNAASTHSSLNRPVGSKDDGSAKELMDLIGEQNAVNGTEYMVTANECFNLLRDEMELLAPLSRRVLAAQFSLPVDGEYSTPQEVRTAYGLSSSRFRRVLQEGLEELKRGLAAKDLFLGDFLEVTP